MTEIKIRTDKLERKEEKLHKICKSVKFVIPLQCNFGVKKQSNIINLSKKRNEKDYDDCVCSAYARFDIVHPGG